MPRGKRTVFAMLCTVCNARVGTVRLHRQREGKSWKDFKVEKFCASRNCRKRQPTKQKEERHSK